MSVTITGMSQISAVVFTASFFFPFVLCADYPLCSVNSSRLRPLQFA